MQDEATPLFVRILIQVVDALGIERGGPALDTMHLVAFLQQELGEVATVLAGNTRDQCLFHMLPIPFEDAAMAGAKPRAREEQALKDGRLLDSTHTKCISALHKDEERLIQRVRE